MERYFFSLCLISLLMGCGANNTPPQVASPGKPLTPYRRGRTPGKAGRPSRCNGSTAGGSGARNERFFGVGTDPRRKIALTCRAPGKPPGYNVSCPKTKRLFSRGAPTAFISRRLLTEGAAGHRPPDTGGAGIENTRRAMPDTRGRYPGGCAAMLAGEIVALAQIR